MAAHPCHHSVAAAVNPSSCYCHCCSPAHTPCHHHHHPPDPHLHHPPHQPHPYSALSHLPNLPQHTEGYQNHYLKEEILTYPAVSSLLRRIAALESALDRRYSHSSHSLRDAAARTIQTHFRSFLLRRSITLRQLKDLASIKSTLGFIKSSVSEKAHFNYDVVYRKAVDLLLKLDTIKGGDPMIRNGKSSLSRDLNKFLDFIDGVYVQRRGFSRGGNVKSIVSSSERKKDNVKCGGQKRAQMEKLRTLVERIDKLAEEIDDEQDELIEKPRTEFITRNRSVAVNRTGGLLKQHSGVHPKVKKNVSFADNGKVYSVLRRPHEPFLEEYCDESNARDSSVDDERVLEDDLSREIEEIGVSSKDDDDDDDDDGGVHLENDGDKESQSYSTSGGNFERKRYEEDDTDDFVFSAPLPAKMEKRGVTQMTRERN